MLVLIFHEDDDICESNERIVGFVEFVTPRKHAMELLNIPKVTFDNISSLVQLLAILPRLLAVAFRRNHRKHPALYRLHATLIFLIHLVHGQRLTLH